MKQVLVIGILSVLIVAPLAAQEQPVARAVLFWMEGCPHCQEIMTEFLPSLQGRFGDQLDITLVEVISVAQVDQLYQTAADLGLSKDQVAVPLLVIGRQVLVGDQIPDRFPAMVEQVLAAGGVDWPDLSGWPVPPAPETPADADATPPLPTVAFWVFWDSHCGPCQELMKGILPSILHDYPQGQVIAHDRDLEKGNYEMLKALHLHHGIDLGEIPEIYIGDQVLLGNDEIQARLPSLISHYLMQGGVDLPPIPPLPTPSPPGDLAAGAPAVHLAYFASLDCQPCDLIELTLTAMEKQYAQLVIHQYSVVGDAALLAQLCGWTGIRVSHCIAPAVFVGQRGLAGDALGPNALTELVTAHLAQGADATWQAGADRGRAGILDLQQLGWLPAAFVLLLLFLLLGSGVWWFARVGRREQADDD